MNGADAPPLPPPPPPPLPPPKRRRRIIQVSSGGGGNTTSTLQLTPLEHGLNALPSMTNGRVVRWQVAREGERVNQGSLLVSCQFDEHQVSVLAPQSGTITKLFCKEDEPITVQSVLADLEYCLHSVVVDGLCTICGSLASAPTTINVEGGHKVQVNQQAALSSRTRTVTRLFQSKRLSLVLDLDHTLVHCSDDPRAPAFAEGVPNTCKFELGGKLLVLKTRPGLAAFLRDMHEHYFDMYVYTAGTRSYAEKVCGIIDPTGFYFGGRIVARDDAPELGLEKSLERLFPVDDTMVVIVDDRDVWHSSPNLVTCEPYNFFHGLHEVNNASWVPDSDGGGGNTNEDEKAAALLEDDAKMDVGLARVSGLLKRVHRDFYYGASGKVSLEQQLAGQGADVKQILAGMKKGILNRAVLAFDPETPRVDVLYQRALVCGAECVGKVNLGVTHLVAPGETELAHFAKGLGLLVVQPRWVELCDHNWQKMPEDSMLVFAVNGLGGRKGDLKAAAAAAVGKSPRAQE